MAGNLSGVDNVSATLVPSVERKLLHFSSMKKSCRANAVHIDRLPEDIVGDILTRLPVQEAVKTSVLSKKWRYAWTKLSKLVFDDMFCDESIKNQQSKLLRAISQVLLLYHGPLHEFKLSLSNLESCSEIDQFILVVLKAGVKEFGLFLLKGEPYRLPSSIFAYEQQLERLNLHSCVFKPPPGFNGFSKLTSLTLTDVGITGKTFSGLTSNCPRLRILGFESSANCGRIDIDNSDLQCFVFKGHCESICFKNAPKLSTIWILTGRNLKGFRREAISQFMLCGRLPVIEELILDHIYAMYVTDNREATLCVNDLYNLETLSLRHTCFGILGDVLYTLRFIRNCKNLENLKIVACIKVQRNAPDMEIKEMEDFSDVTLDHLKEVKLLNLSGLKSELQFIELILAKSPVLEKLTIKLHPVFVGDKELRFFKELSKFRRASTLVEVAYEDGDDI